MDKYLLISDAAKEVQVESHVLRYWEDELKLPIKRNELGHRYYTDEDVDRFKQIKIMKEQGLQLKAIRMILKDGKLKVITPEEQMLFKETGKNESENEITGVFEKTEENMQENMQNNTTKRERQDTKQEKMQENMQENMHIMPITIVSEDDTKEENKKELDNAQDKAKRLQWLLRQLIRETLMENNQELCREIKENLVKELDYQFRAQEERQEERDRLQDERNEAYYQRMDELLRRKSVQKAARRKETNVINYIGNSREDRKEEFKEENPQTAEDPENIATGGAESMGDTENAGDAGNTEKRRKRKKHMKFFL